ncbi:MAG TPA: ABC transporter permease [Actinophytocola sp.]|uniref:ABC transporter permease n=1 Tax=Actinophytocola sp. TaxID=1872138 RepID=UPI002DB67E17|nr:ABC transporter permease [Actinophytocola sp.]HEU5471088.1 ABC transporter permease [Actinophytocola sp.]
MLLGTVGLRGRPERVALTALGIAIDVAAMVAVVGISTSSRAQLDRELAKLGTNLLTVEPGSTMFGEAAKLPVESVPMVGRIRPARSVSAIGRVQAAVSRNDHMPAGNTGGIAVLAARPDLLDSVGGRAAWGGGARLAGRAAAGRSPARHPGVARRQLVQRDRGAGAVIGDAVTRRLRGQFPRH